PCVRDGIRIQRAREIRAVFNAAIESAVGEIGFKSGEVLVTELVDGDYDDEVWVLCCNWEGKQTDKGEALQHGASILREAVHAEARRRGGREVVDDPTETFLESCGAEIDEEADLQIGEAEIREELFVVHGSKFLDRLNLDDDA